jgi:hypothetical protein
MLSSRAELFVLAAHQGVLSTSKNVARPLKIEHFIQLIRFQELRGRQRSNRTSRHTSRVHVSGYPPCPEQLICAISLLQQKIQRGPRSLLKILNTG